MMSISLLNSVLDDPTSEGPQKAILMLLAFRADESGKVWISTDTISEKVGIHRATVFRSLNKLEQSGHILRESKAGQYGNNRYTIQSQRATVAESDSSRERRLTVAESDGNSRGERHNRPIDPIKTLKKSKPKKEAHEGWIEDWFENQFWKPFPPRRKCDKNKCFTFIKNILRTQTGSKELAQEIEDGLTKWNASNDWTRERGEFAPMPYTWLNNRRWECPPEKPETQQAGSMSTDYATDSPMESTGDPVADLERYKRLQAEGRRVPEWKIEATKKQIEETI